MPSRIAFITGATGFLGLNIVDALLDADWAVVALHRKTSNVSRLKARGVDLAEGTLDDRASLEAAIPEHCDAVFHVAGNISLWSKNDAQQTKDNVDGTRNVANAALARKAKRFVHTSSVAVWGAQEKLPYDETCPQRGVDSTINYQRSKHLGELEVRKAIERGLDAVITNPSHIVGRYDVDGWSKTIRLVAEGKLPGIPPGKGSFCDAAAVARAHVAAVDRGRTGENYILGGADATYLELVTIIGELLGKKVGKSAVPLWTIGLVSGLTGFASLFTGKQPAVTPEMVEGLRHHEIVSCEKAVKELGYEKVPLRTMLETALAWQVEEGIVKNPTPPAPRPAGRAGGA
ncbi:MAG: NAD-dependent epimerase/dehydratase family protein [Polyangiaceae bacterium]